MIVEGQLAKETLLSLRAFKVCAELPRICSDINAPKILIQVLQVSFLQWVVCFKIEHLISLKIYQVFDL